MPMIQNIDRNRFNGGHLKPPNNHPIYLKKKKQGDGIIDVIKEIGNVINENKDTVSAVSSTISSVANAGKAIADTIKVSKELEQLKTIQEIRKKKKHKPKEIELTPEQIEALKKLGSGFVKT